MTVFLSYSTKDYLFAELAEIKLGEAGIKLWRDQGSLIAGTDWRQGIESGISNSIAVLIALSKNSAESSYVTYEWAYAIGNGKSVIPLKLNDCVVHPRLTTIQYLDFTGQGALPWQSLIERIREIETDSEINLVNPQNTPGVANSNQDDNLMIAILDYLNRQGYQVASFDRLKENIYPPNLTDDRLEKVIKDNKTIFRPARIKGNKKGLGKIIP
jgi:hypothetical protein